MTITVAKHSGYLAAAAAVSFTGTQTLASLGDGEWTNLSDEIDNSTNKYALVDLYLDLASAAFTSSGVEIYLVPSVDGTTYPTWTGNVSTEEPENQTHFVGSMNTTESTAVQDTILRNVVLPPGKYKWGVRNQTGIAFAASGNTLYWRPHSLAGDDS